jgi:hypothetical protein
MIVTASQEELVCFPVQSIGMADQPPFPRFAIVNIGVPGLTPWQVHKSGCADVSKWVNKGAFVKLVSSRSAENLIAEEIAFHKNKGITEDDFQIMSCCRTTAESLSGRPAPGATPA